MKEGVERTGRPRRISAGRLAQIVGVVLVGLGIALVVLPYDTAITIDAPPGHFDLSQLPTEGRCEAPILDARHGEPDLWINYSSESGTTVEHDGKLTGSWCSPESLQRGGGGTVLVLVGITIAVLGTVSTRRARRRREVSPAPE